MAVYIYIFQLVTTLVDDFIFSIIKGWTADCLCTMCTK